MNTRQLAGPVALSVRALSGLVFGALAGFLIRHGGLSMLFLAAMFGGAMFLSWGLGASRVLIAIAIWLGQYSIFYWRFPRPITPSEESEVPLLVVHGLFAFLPGTALVVGTYIGLLVERMLRDPQRSSPTGSNRSH